MPRLLSLVVRASATCARAALLGLSAALAPLASAAAQERVAASSRNEAVLPGASTAREANAARVAAAPELDGRDDDPAWRSAPLIVGFLEYEPNEGAETRFRTEARAAYDDRYFYVLVRMYDPAPDSIVSLLSRRDVRTNSEQVKIVIDSYHDRRTAYQFAVNPAGVKRDFYVYNDGIEDPSWDAVWDVGTGIDSLGWVAEFRIPFSQLRFPRRDTHTFGLMIVRDVARTGQRISWPLFRRNVQGYVSQAGELHGITGVPTPRRLELAPYLLAADESRRVSDGFDRGQRLTGGLDLKYGVTSNLTLDATVNPDFGQVEADPAVLNLGTTETFLSERRPFFLEGTGIFTFDVVCEDVDSGCSGLFYSRRIGRVPQLGDLYGGDLAPDATTILGAAKLTGRLANGLSIGVLDAVTQREEGELGRPVEPRTNYLAARVQQELRDGQTVLGAMATAVDRQLDVLAEPHLHRGAYAGGIDLRHRFLDRRYQFSTYVAGSLVRGDAAAIEATQRSAVHNFSRPDGEEAVDPGATQLGGAAFRVALAKFGGGKTRFETVYQRLSPGFEINDLGYLGRADEQMLRNWFSLQFNTPTRAYRRMFLNFNQWTHWTAGGLRTHFGGNFNGHMELPNTWWLHAGLTAGNLLPSYDDREARGGPAVRRSRIIEGFTGVEGDRRNPVVPVLFTGGWRGDDGRSSGWWIEPSVEIRASSRFSMVIGPYWRRAIDDNQWVDNFGDIGHDTTHYTFARLRQTTASVTTRLNYTHSPNLSFQLYAQPFITEGTFANWRELADPRAERYDERYQPYAGDPGGFDFKQMNTNAVLRWEYRPGSALFVVWSQGKEQFRPLASEFRLRDDSMDLWRIEPDNRLLVKLSYWFNP